MCSITPQIALLGRVYEPDFRVYGEEFDRDQVQQTLVAKVNHLQKVISPLQKNNKIYVQSMMENYYSEKALNYLEEMRPYLKVDVDLLTGNRMLCAPRCLKESFDFLQYVIGFSKQSKESKKAQESKGWGVSNAGPSLGFQPLYPFDLRLSSSRAIAPSLLSAIFSQGSASSEADRK